MSLKSIYAFTVLVSSRDGRSAHQTVLVTPTVSGSAQVTIINSFKRFNPSTKLVLNGYLSASYSVNTTWSVFTALGQPVSIVSLTAQSKSFPAQDALSQIKFPLSVNGGILMGGEAYTFRLTVFQKNRPETATFAEISLISNVAPTSGHIVSSPTNGSALVTQFTVSSPGWTTDAASFPLSYAFSYELSSASPYLTIAASSLRSFVTTALPAGLLTEKYTLTLQTQVTDIYLSFSTATTPVQVTLAAATNVSEILSKSLNSAFATSAFNLAIQTINNVASTVNTVDCSASPVCSVLNRMKCLSTTNICGACLLGFKGRILP